MIHVHDKFQRISEVSGVRLVLWYVVVVRWLGFEQETGGKNSLLLQTGAGRF
jgi:hypothetical protein